MKCIWNGTRVRISFSFFGWATSLTQMVKPVHQSANTCKYMVKSFELGKFFYMLRWERWWLSIETDPCTCCFPSSNVSKQSIIPASCPLLVLDFILVRFAIEHRKRPLRVPEQFVKPKKTGVNSSLRRTKRHLILHKHCRASKSILKALICIQSS